MRELVQEIIKDGQEANLFTGTPRRISLEHLSGKATVVMGVRRCGKSTLLHQIIARLGQSGVSRNKIAYLNFADERLGFLRRDGLTLVADAYYSIYPETKNEETVYFFFDEIQDINGWELFVERLLRTERCEIFITGSSAKLLSRELATQLRGRSISWELFPFSLHEHLHSCGIDAAEPWSSRTRMKIQRAFDSYWEHGGFPEVGGLSKRMTIKVHQEYFQTVLYRDVVERYDVPHPKALRDLAHHLIDNTGSLYSLNRLYGQLKTWNHSIQKSSVAQYVDWLEDAYFLFSVRLFDASSSRSNANPKKIYCIDHALVRSVSSGILVNSGHLLENLVFVTLRRLSQEVYYYRTKRGREVDFLCMTNRRVKQIVQVCETLQDTKTLKREKTALFEAMDELDLEDSIIVTRDESDVLREHGKTIHVVPAWKFLLNADDNNAEVTYTSGL